MSIKEDVEEIKMKAEKLEHQNLATEIYSDYAKANKRLFVVLIVVLCMWFTTIGYLVYVLNDIGVIETTVEQENSDGYNNYIGEDGDIDNG